MRTYQVNSWVSVRPKTEAALMEALTHGPISVAIEGSLLSFQLYSGGVYHSAKCGKELNHGKLMHHGFY